MKKLLLLRRIMSAILNTPLRYFGYEIRSIPLEEKNRSVWLKRAGIHTVLDIGANTGQFAEKIIKILSDVKVYSFEPLQECLQQLYQLQQRYRNLEVLPYACGEREEKAEMFHSVFSPSSSLLKMNDRHEELYPNTINSFKEIVTVKRLDDIAAMLTLSPEVLLKMDVQGFEDRVIKGGRNTLRKVKVVLVEVSFEELYEEQGDFHTVYSLLYEVGFEFAGFWEQFCSSQTGLPIQADAIFIRKTL